jgi:hypothetical protein
MCDCEKKRQKEKEEKYFEEPRHFKHFSKKDFPYDNELHLNFLMDDLIGSLSPWSSLKRTEEALKEIICFLPMIHPLELRKWTDVGGSLRSFRNFTPFEQHSHGHSIGMMVSEDETKLYEEGKIKFVNGYPEKIDDTGQI